MIHLLHLESREDRLNPPHPRQWEVTDGGVGAGDGIDLELAQQRQGSEEVVSSGTWAWTL